MTHSEFEHKWGKYQNQFDATLDHSDLIRDLKTLGYDGVVLYVLQCTHMILNLESIYPNELIYEYFNNKKARLI